jgi:hypothetical protein
MPKNFIIITLAVALISVFADATATARSKKPKLLTDGFVLAGVDGELAGPDSSDKWFFKLDSDVSDGRGGNIKAGTALELLPSATLEKIVANAKENSATTYRLWARVTRYGGKNFLFPIHFLAISKIERPQPQPAQQQQDVSPTINDPNDELTIPSELLEKLQARKIVRIEQLKKGVELKADSILADRTAFIVGADDDVVLSLDALGRNIEGVSICLLPCQALERALQAQADELDPVRFKVAGILTQYKGRYYLLLQRAIQAYSCENFPR